MDATAAQAKRRRLEPVATAVAVSLERVARASMYADAPRDEVSLPRAEQLGRARLRVLRLLEARNAEDTLEGAVGGGGGGGGPRYARLCADVLVACERAGLATADADTQSHFILRLACSRARESSDWFVALETQLFRIRLGAEPGAVGAFIAANDLPFRLVGPDDDLAPEECSAMARLFGPSGRDVYATPFENALALVGTRAAYLRRGVAYVPGHRVALSVQHAFRAHLRAALVRTAAHRVTDARIRALVTCLLRQPAAPPPPATALAPPEDRLSTAASVRGAAAAMPMCMAALYERLVETKHLKHHGRRVLGLFLREAGLGVQQALVFWRAAFARVPPGVFDRQYAYGIRHDYGLAGDRRARRPYGCEALVRAAASGGASTDQDAHACPFRAWDETALRRRWTADGIQRAEQDRVAALVRAGHYQVACRAHWIARHPGGDGSDAAGRHPNRYLAASLQYHRTAAAAAAAAAAQPPARAASNAAPA